MIHVTALGRFYYLLTRNMSPDATKNSFGARWLRAMVTGQFLLCPTDKLTKPVVFDI